MPRHHSRKERRRRNGRTIDAGFCGTQSEVFGPRDYKDIDDLLKIITKTLQQTGQTYIPNELIRITFDYVFLAKQEFIMEPEGEMLALNGGQLFQFVPPNTARYRSKPQLGHVISRWPINIVQPPLKFRFYRIGGDR